jgi:hypothetical protein
MNFTLKRLLHLFNWSSDQENGILPVKTSYKRAFDRFPIEFDVIVSVIGGADHHDSERSELHDVSGGGAMFISRFPERYYSGQFLKLDIFLAGTEDVRACIKTEASVVRIHQIETNDLEDSGIETGVAVKFHKPFEFERIDSSFSGNLP